ncbi:MAG TPA: protein translocase subunit SecD [Bryobacteraceae bacterium]|nr:protein translocase subunit SecD [Bryobacteraceae bacterium]
MQKSLRWRWTLIAIVLLLSVYGVIGLPKSMAELKTNLDKNIRLGLDLKGGSHLILQVQVQDAAKVEADQAIERLKDELRKAGVNYASMERNDPTTIEQADSIQIDIRGVPAEKSGDLRRIVSERFATWVLTPVSSTDYRMNMRPSELLALKSDTVERSIRTIEQRINGLGLTEPVIQQHGRTDAEFEILVQLPGVDDPARVKQIMQTAAMLEISEVKDGPFASPEQAMAKHGGVLPLNTKLVKMAPGKSEGDSWYLLTRTPVITGRDLRTARPGRDEFQKWEADFTLSQDGARRFGRFTEANIGNRLAVILDNQIRSVATIQARIEDSGRITGLSGEQEASDLALVLRAGSLPAGIVYLEERTVGPSLGSDSIRQGVVAGLVGLALVILVMLVYYRKAGVNAVVALILNGVITIAMLGYFDAVWTLPGIAGLILSLGMAVDSNVLIFERIREEMRAGKAAPSAVSAGFDRVFLTIIDTHVTTVVACAFLFMFGTGPVKGFAVTLVIGLIANVFTAVFVSRTMFEFSFYRNPKMAELSI